MTFFILLYKKITKFYSALFVFAMIFMCQNSTISAQNSVEQGKKYLDRLKNAELKVSKKDFKINGRFKASSGYRPLTTGNQKPFEYKVQANLNLSFKGLTIPLSYTFSNGRSFTSINGPQFNIPSFKQLGISPNYEWATAHIGHRTMSFSKYTYQNLRFKGVGIELKPNDFFLKAFRGELFSTSQEDLFRINNNTSRYKRQAWGGTVGYSNEKLTLQGTAFSAEDDPNSIVDDSARSSINPKANTVLGFNAARKFGEDTEVIYEYALSAYSKSTFDQRVDIPSGMTLYNMAGLFEKRTSSLYSTARELKLNQKYKEGTYGLRYEAIEGGFRSLGALIYDNDFQNYTINGAYPISEKLSISSEVGIRRDGISRNTSKKTNRFVGSLNSTYRHNDRSTYGFTFTNFRSVDRLLFQNANLLEPDSTTLAVLNSNISVTANYLLGEQKTTVLNFMLSKAGSSSIVEDTISTTNRNNTNLFMSSITKSIEAHEYTVTNMLMYNKTAASSIFSVIPTLKHRYKPEGPLNIENSFTYSYLRVIGLSNTNNIQFNHNLIYKFSKKLDAQFGVRTTLANQGGGMNFRELMIEIELNGRL